MYDTGCEQSVRGGIVSAGEYEITYEVDKPLARIFTIEDALSR